MRAPQLWPSNDLRRTMVRRPRGMATDGGSPRSAGAAGCCPTRHWIEDHEMRIPWRAREYERTCADCGHAWRVPRWAVHPPRMQGLPRDEGGGPWAVQQAAAAATAANAQMAERASQFRVCPECNSAKYAQRPVRS